MRNLILYYMLFVSVAFSALVILVPSAAFYTNPSTVAFSFDYKSAVVGDSWSQPKPFSAQIRIGKGCASIEDIKQLVRDFQGTVDTVYIVTGVANTACHGYSLEDTMNEMQSLIDLCQKKLRPRVIIAYDPRVMWKLLGTPQYCQAPFPEPISVVGYEVYDLHVNSLGYQKLKASRPLSISAF